ncbi:MAG TPA: hypothetical protein VGX78_02390, partial [Pirellulales bacterium]|nr:hypothetical protein [Pirellulales bacterium]
MSSVIPVCRTIEVFAFRGDRTRGFAAAFQKKLQDGKNGLGAGPTMLECLLHAGHAGVSVDGRNTIYGFNPDAGALAVWQLLERLKQGEGFQGVVRDDLAVFNAAQHHPLTIVSFEVVLPDSRFQEFQSTLD